eukprot:4356729-Pleurochrysis_carterae.AAC.1
MQRTAVASATESMMRALEMKGLPEASLRALNEFQQDFDRMNHSLPISNRLADSLIADKLANAIRKIKDGLRSKIDVQLTVNRKGDDLSLALDAFRF